MPAAAAVTLLIDGFCTAELNEFGPTQAYVGAGEPPLVEDVRFSVPPTQGVLAEAVGDAGAVLIVTATVVEVLPHAFVAVTV